MRSPPAEEISPSRRGRFPDPRISLRIGIIETRRLVRKVRQQDFWLLLMGFGLLFFVLALPILYEISQDIGRTLIDEGTIDAGLFPLFVTVAWVTMVAFGLFSGLTGEGELTDQEAILTIRPVKDVAGGLVVYVLLGYAPFVLLLAGVVGAGIAVGSGAPSAVIGILLAAICLLISGVLIGYVLGIFAKGIVRRSPWLTTLKPILGVVVIFGYFWLSFTGQLWAVLEELGSLLQQTPLRWFAELALVTTPGMEASIFYAVVVVILTIVSIPVGVLAVIRAGEFAWFVEIEGDDRETEPAGGESGVYIWYRLDDVLRRMRVSSATRGVTITVLIRGYRAPLQLVFVLVPLLFLIPLLDSIVRTGIVPEWFPWMVMAYGAWAAGVAFPLNILGTQGAMLPRLLVSPANGTHVVRGYVLATALLFVPLTVTLGVVSGQLAERAVVDLVVIAIGAVGIVLVSALLSVAVGVTFPRFSSIDLTENTQIVIPSKFAFMLFSLLAAVLSNAIGVVADELIRSIVSSILSTYLPFGLTVTVEQLELIGYGLLVMALIAAPAAYIYAVNRVADYRVS